MKQDKYTKSARGKECQIRLPGCLFTHDSVVLCHLNGAGVALKHSNIHGSYGCSNCHDIVDGRKPFDVSQEYILLSHLQGVIRTQVIMIKDGILKL